MKGLSLVSWACGVAEVPLGAEDTAGLSRDAEDPLGSLLTEVAMEVMLLEVHVQREPHSLRESSLSWLPGSGSWTTQFLGGTHEEDMAATAEGGARVCGGRRRERAGRYASVRVLQDCGSRDGVAVNI